LLEEILLSHSKTDDFLHLKNWTHKSLETLYQLGRDKPFMQILVSNISRCMAGVGSESEKVGQGSKRLAAYYM
jgi:hypothetical protein